MLFMKEELNVNCAKALETSVENHGSENAVKSEVDDIYTPLEEAKEEIWRRWNDKALRKKVEDFLGGDIPSVFKEAPRAVLGRHILSPNFELLHFLKVSNATKLRPLCLEYLRDKFVAENIDKYYLCRLFFHDGLGKRKGDRLSVLKMMNFENTEGKTLSELKTVSGESIIHFHHNLIRSFALDSKIDFFDLSSFLNRKGGTANKYYVYYLSFFVCYGILFENYLLSKGQKGFVENLVIPQCQQLKNIFGVSPLIVKLGPEEDMENLYWKYYPKIVRDKVRISYRAGDKYK